MKALSIFFSTKIFKILVMDLNPAFHSHADPDSASKDNADPEPLPCYVEGGEVILI